MRDSGEIRIELYREENEAGTKSINKDCSTTFTLTVSDNWVGIPELNIDDLESFGMQLATSLVDQLDGELELKRENEQSLL